MIIILYRVAIVSLNALWNINREQLKKLPIYEKCFGFSSFRNESTMKETTNEDGIKTRISYKINEKNELIKVTQQIKVITEIKKMSKNVLERRERLKNKKFGNAINNDNNNIT